MPFEKLDLEDMLRVRKLLEKKLPTSTMVLNILDLSIKLNDSTPNGMEQVDIYRFNKVPNEQNLFIVVFFVLENFTTSSAVFAPENISEEMMTSFSKLIDWSQPHMFMAINAHFLLHLEALSEMKKGQVYKGPCALMHLPIEDALKLKLQKPEHEDEFTLRELQPEHASKVNAHWKYGGPKEEKFLESSIEHLGCTAGIFKRSEALTKVTNENLVSWVVYLRIGTLNALHTLEDVRGKGLGRWTMEAASKSVAEKGLIPLCAIEDYNKESRRLVERIGFKKVCDVDWVIYKPTS